jgi:hypothetical protein
MNTENNNNIIKPNPEYRKIFSTAKVIDVDDPLLLGRVRVLFDNMNNSEILKSIQSTKDGKRTKTKNNKDLLPQYKWSDIDKFVCNTLLPVFLKMTQKIGERVNIFVPNRQYTLNQLYYTPAAFSTTLTQYQENDIQQEQFITKRLKDTLKIKNPIDNSYYNEELKGAFIEPGDIGIAGRGTCDLIVKDNDIILRAGKTDGIPINPNKAIAVKPNRSFIQLSNFTETISEDVTKTVTTFFKVISYVKTLVEWTIYNPQNQFDLYTFKIEIFGLPEKPSYTTENLNISSDIPMTDRTTLYACIFQNKSMFEMTQIITNFITQCNEGRINIPPNPIFDLQNQFPLYYRPSQSTYFHMRTSAENTEYKQRLISLYDSIKFKSNYGGSGLINSRNSTGPGVDSVKEVQKNYKVDPNKSTTYIVQGADKFVFVSHGSSIPSKKQIGLNEKSIYGLSQEVILNDLIPNTEPMVRGTQLIDFLDKLLQWVTNHEHGGPGQPPTTRGSNSVTAQNLRDILANAAETILNQNIRIN